MKITDKELQEYFASKGVPEICPACGHEDWELPVAQMATDDTLDITICRLLVPTSDVTISSPYVPSILFVCKHCGYIRLFHAKMIQEWLDSREGKQ